MAFFFKGRQVVDNKRAKDDLIELLSFVSSSSYIEDEYKRNRIYRTMELGLIEMGADYIWSPTDGNVLVGRNAINLYIDFLNKSNSVKDARKKLESHIRSKGQSPDTNWICYNIISGMIVGPDVDLMDELEIPTQEIVNELNARFKDNIYKFTMQSGEFGCVWEIAIRIDLKMDYKIK